MDRVPFPLVRRLVRPAPRRNDFFRSRPRVYGGTLMADPARRDRLAGITVPALVLWGDADQIADAGYGRAYAAAIPRCPVPAPARHRAPPADRDPGPVGAGDPGLRGTGRGTAGVVFGWRGGRCTGSHACPAGHDGCAAAPGRVGPWPGAVGPRLPDRGEGLSRVSRCGGARWPSSTARARRGRSTARGWTG